MNIVFIHSSFPGQFRSLVESIAKEEKNKTIFITTATGNKDLQIKGVKKIIIAEKDDNDENKLKPLKNPPAIPVVNVLTGLKKQEFIPDIIIGHSGNGMTLYVKDVFPETPFLSFFDWFHGPNKLQPNFEEGSEPDLKVRMNLRNKNMPVLADLLTCDGGFCPSEWQKGQFPNEFHHKLKTVHDGIDTTFFKPSNDTSFKINDLDLSDVKQIITYATNLLAPYRGFQEFMESLPIIMEQRPDTHVVILGPDRVSFGDKEGKKKSFKSLIFEKVEIDSERIHFLDGLGYEDYITLLQVSSAHVYVDSPLVVSRPLLEAMSCECLVIAPNTPPVREVITDGKNGFIADFSSPNKIAEKNNWLP